MGPALWCMSDGTFDRGRAPLVKCPGRRRVVCLVCRRGVARVPLCVAVWHEVCMR